MLVFQLSKAQREQLRRLADEIAAHDSAERVSREQRFGAENRRTDRRIPASPAWSALQEHLVPL